MPGRTRSRTYARSSGPARNNLTGALSGFGQVFGGNATCQDVTGYGDCFGLIINTLDIQGGVINWPNPNTFGSSFSNYIADGIRSGGFGDHIGVSGVPSDVDAATMAAARTNPSRPYVDVPVNILDISEAPSRILRDIADVRRAGFWRPPRPPRSPREAASKVGETWLQYNFMVAPLVGDIVRMGTAVDQINRRVDEINRLYGGTGLRRTVTVFNGSEHAVSTSSVVQSAGVFIQPRFDIITSVTKRVHVRWEPTSRCGLAPSPAQRRAWATRAVLGLTLDLSTLWEITPWSWLADYFGNVGTYLKATRNIIPARLVGVYPMTHTKTIWECPETSRIQNGVLMSMSGIRSVRQRKSRTSSFIAPVAHFNFLNGNQMGNLAAIAATRSSPRRG